MKYHSNFFSGSCSSCIFLCLPVCVYDDGIIDPIFIVVRLLIIIKQTPNQQQWPTVLATKWWRLCPCDKLVWLNDLFRVCIDKRKTCTVVMELIQFIPTCKQDWSGLRASLFYNMWYSGFSTTRTPIIRIRTPIIHIQSPIIHIRTLAHVTLFSAAVGKDVAVTAVLLQEKAKLLYEQLFLNTTTPFSSSTTLGSRFTTFELAE